ncbi:MULTISPECIES: hypothetical protein [Rhodococcus]|uniref:Uncharacterized protein n=1 Tax=Rhodococcus aetherivorans TaxID=191292 RepID=A0AA46PNA4_9NOCA|nr:MULTISPECIES: hypothetical protein [Rhodococcus]AKE88487.1 hypothetical protein AAT18_03780 [Rhodococcus aetherivorans]MDV6295620.1 hypothetical protein [Rhodococcus aetherivorans]PND49465.1 hypothetical protein CQZ88_24395 [Rhodococcus sp. ENV425]UGQ40665.1 hypothetical protein LRQ66_21315 [Rhodococcus aetherivorans]UYF93742.1 hypothetical protein OCS65_25455 [Rhodococcus aetherivorans]
MNDLLRQVAELRTDLQALDRRVRSLAEAFDLVDPVPDDDAAEANLREVIDGLSDAHLDLSTADKHLETVASHAARLGA